MGKAVIENAVDIDRPALDVFDYACDHTHEMEWNPKMRSVRKLTDGPIRKGTQYDMEFVPGRPVMVTCVGFDRPHRWEAVGTTLGMHISLGGEVAPVGKGSRLTLRTQFEANFPLGLALPLVARRMEREMQRDVETIKAILETAESKATAHV